MTTSLMISGVTTAPVPTTIAPPDNALDRYMKDPYATNHAIGETLTSIGHQLILGIACLAPLLLVAAIAVAIQRRNQANAMTEGARVLELALPPQVDGDGAELFWTNLHDLLRPAWKRFWKGQPHVVFELVWRGSQLTIRLWVPQEISIDVVNRAVAASWPGVAIKLAEETHVLPEGSTVAGGELRLWAKEWFSIKTDHSSDPLRAVIGAVGPLDENQSAAVQILARPVTGRRTAKCLKAARQLRSGKSASIGLKLLDLIQPGVSTGLTNDDPNRSADIRAMTEKANSICWEARVRYAVGDTNTDRARHQSPMRAHGLASAFALYSGRNRLRRCRLRNATQVIESRRLGRADLFTVAEMSALAHLPTEESIPGVERASAQPMAPISRIPTTGKVLGDSDIGAPRPVAINAADAPFHVHLMGSTGTGKSTLLTNLVLSDAKARRGAVVIDPKGDLITDILDRLPDANVANVVLIDPEVKDATPSMNVLEGEDDGLVVDNIVGIFHRIFEAYWGPRTDDVLRSACLTLLRGDRATLADVPRLLTDPGFRRHYTRHIDRHDGLSNFWDWYDKMGDTQRTQAVGPLMNKLRAFFLRDFVADILASPTSNFDIPATLDSGLLLVRLPKGILGGETTKLLGSLIVARVWQAALARAKSDVDGRLGATLYIDECHNFLNMPGSVDEMLAEARGYGLSLVLAHQHLGQLNREMRDAISANARHKVFFTMSPEDAHVLSRHVGPELSEHDLSHLGGYQAAARLIVEGRDTPACTIATRPPELVIPGRRAAVRASVKGRFGKNAKPHNKVSNAPKKASGWASRSGTGSGTGLASGNPEEAKDAGSGGTGLPDRQADSMGN